MGQTAKRSAFTLIEVLIAVGLTALLLGAMFTFLDNLGRRRDGIGRAASVGRDASSLIDRVEADLAMSLAGDARGGAGVVGTATHLTVLTRRVVAGADGNSLGFSKSAYSFDSATGVLAAGRGASLKEEPSTQPVIAGVRRVRFRYYNGHAWQSEFDSASTGNLPAAVEIAIWFGSPSPAENSVRPAEPDRISPPDRMRVMNVPDGSVAAWKDQT